ncbi:hypothetical protein [Apilactobacillus kunkeei]|uniref:hypothetical protein n=1 Tax=Apilactobacillus kunkeei TaxID=148814 RepID=UPI001C891E24|nr:hypothetical protein [Apilactobacillus kunkeei]MBX8456245.1 hypothetical protein [Apilactobacillus kunkeei]
MKALKVFIEKHYGWWLLAFIILEGANLFTSIRKSTVLSIISDSLLLVMSALLYWALTQRKNKK